jgi:hypothetical protein
VNIPTNKTISRSRINNQLAQKQHQTEFGWEQLRVFRLLTGENYSSIARRLSVFQSGKTRNEKEKSVSCEPFAIFSLSSLLRRRRMTTSSVVFFSLWLCFAFCYTWDVGGV